MSSSNDLLLHSKTARSSKRFLDNPIGPLLILGDKGSGKLYLAQSLAQSALGLKTVGDLLTYPYYSHIKRPEGKQDISIDAARQIRRWLKLKTAGASGIRRVVIIEEASLLSLEAQNALLKTLEEPNEDTLFILTAPNKINLLPTIVSRCQQIWVHPIPFSQAVQFYNNSSPQKVEAAWRLSQGGSSLLDALLKEDSAHPLRQSINQAKTLLGQSRYERLLWLDQLNPNKFEALLLLEALSKVLAALYRSALDKKRLRQAKNLMADRKLVLNSLRAYEHNANQRLIFLNLVLSLKN